MASLSNAPSLLGSKSCPGTKPIFAMFATIGASSADGGFFFIASARLVEVSVDVQSIHLIAYCRFHVEVGIDLARGRRVWLAIGTERNKQKTCPAVCVLRRSPAGVPVQ